MGNLVYKHPNATDCKYIKAYEMMRINSGHRSNIINKMEESNVPATTNDTGNGHQSHGSIWEKT